MFSTWKGTHFKTPCPKSKNSCSFLDSELLYDKKIVFAEQKLFPTEENWARNPIPDRIFSTSRGAVNDSSKRKLKKRSNLKVRKKS